eukprot:CAMPEP_0204562032 /NCGR_PEP_ID=MMETSP0661-20131031/33523_1 /ASSEMBLY_ACC=CAM_ASM_000606 /TAXON_ID=109239 /ORGANISM="Alexandrium margalefi, Strain AMGDE01CS-322" /LENGTH=186 /DNA_ID=CAMNT_0051569495 /DNA_START=36 /DNA_END=596 /DNA_ORIENTATION=-
MASLLVAMGLCGAAIAAAVEYPHVGENSLSAGGGGSCEYEYASHGGKPVVMSASCTITTADLDTGSEPKKLEDDYVRTLGGHDGCSNDDAGHILANRLGGQAVPINLFPQSPHLNRGAWEKFERGIYACLHKDGASSAKLSWTWEYSASDSLRPSTASYSASYDGGCQPASKSFSNACAEELSVHV